MSFFARTHYLKNYTEDVQHLAIITITIPFYLIFSFILL